MPVDTSSHIDHLLTSGRRPCCLVSTAGSPKSPRGLHCRGLGLDDTRLSTEGVPARRVVYTRLIGLGLLLTGMVLLNGCGHAGGRPGAATERTPFSSGGPPAALAGSLASYLLARIVLPSPAKPVGSLPPGTHGRLDRPAPSELSGPVVDRHRFWVVHESPAALLAFFARWRPSGGMFFSSGSEERDGRADYWTEEFAFPITARSLRAERLSVAIARAGAGGLAVRIDARVAWRVPRPGGSRVPRGANNSRLRSA
jgi:hypothetical protein